MDPRKAFRLAAILGLVLSVLAGCASAPNQELSDARQAIQAARDAGAEEHAPDNLKAAQQYLGKAEQWVETGDYESAVRDAVAAKKAAVSARNIALAIGAARSALETAKKLGAEWRDTGKMLEQAAALASKGDESGAVKLAGEAKFQAEAAIAQHYLEAAKLLLSKAEKKISSMNADQRALYEEAVKAYRDQNGRKAFDLATRLLAGLKTDSTADSYQVVSGDHLWGISARPVIYSNPYQWPMIYKANTHQIKDADLIFPGQQLSIPRQYSGDDVDAAVRHARSRGAWSLNRVEETDKAYLAR